MSVGCEKDACHKRPRTRTPWPRQNDNGPARWRPARRLMTDAATRRPTPKIPATAATLHGLRRQRDGVRFRLWTWSSCTHSAARPPRRSSSPSRHGADWTVLKDLAAFVAAMRRPPRAPDRRAGSAREPDPDRRDQEPDAARHWQPPQRVDRRLSRSAAPAPPRCRGRACALTLRPRRRIRAVSAVSGFPVRAPARWRRVRRPASCRRIRVVAGPRLDGLIRLTAPAAGHTAGRDGGGQPPRSAVCRRHAPLSGRTPHAPMLSQPGPTFADGGVGWGWGGRREGIPRPPPP